MRKIDLLFILFGFPLLQIMFSDTYFPSSHTDIAEPPRIHKRDSVLYVQRILILGDSHLLGHFGEMLQKGIHETGHFDILSIAIGGAGSRNFTMPMRNLCCGYAIRETFYNETVPSPDKIRIIEGNNNLTGEIIGKNYKGKLQEIVERFDPNIVVIALGHNNINDHQNLVNIIRTAGNSSQIIWVAPFRNRSIHRQLADIKQVVSKNNLLLIRSDDILGSDSATCVHFYGRIAQNWALNIVQRMQPFISTATSSADIKNNNTEMPDHQTVTILSRFVEDNLFARYQHDKQTAFQLLTGLFKPEYHFFPRYLNRTFADDQKNSKNRLILKDIDGNLYSTIQIGHAVWMAEDLRTTRFRNGEPLQKFDNTQKTLLQDETYLQNKFRKEEGSANATIFYNWYVVSNAKGLCPDGWHIPDFSDWKYLTQNLEHPSVFFRTPSSWVNSDGRFIEETQSVYIWTAEKVSDFTKSAWVGGFDKQSRSFIILNRKSNTSFPVRCVKD
jgi:hypothetical protein